VEIYRAYFKHEDEHEGYENTLGYYKDRDDAEAFVTNRACEEFPDNIEGFDTLLEFRDENEMVSLRDTRHEGNNYYCVERIIVK